METVPAGALWKAAGGLLYYSVGRLLSGFIDILQLQLCIVWWHFVESLTTDCRRWNSAISAKPIAMISIGSLMRGDLQNTTH